MFKESGVPNGKTRALKKILAVISFLVLLISANLWQNPALAIKATVSGVSISGVKPGKVYVGNRITISGKNFSTTPNENLVDFPGTDTNGTIISASAKQLVVTVPEGSVSGKISVTTNGVTVQTKKALTILTPPIPSITSISPIRAAPGARVTLTGKNFAATLGGNTVNFVGTETMGTVTSATAKKLIVTIPSGAVTGRISVTAGGQTGQSAQSLTIIGSPDPTPSPTPTPDLTCDLTTDPQIVMTKETLGVDKGDYMNGPTVIKVPDWVASPLGSYYMYFADHKGNYIRLAYANSPTGPWTVYEPGALDLDPTLSLESHIASPDIYVDESAEKIYMTVHGEQTPPKEYEQVTVLVESNDGLNFSQDPGYAHSLFAPYAYARVFEYNGTVYRLNPREGSFRVEKASGILGPYSTATTITTGLGLPIRHIGVQVSGSTLYVFYTITGDKPERIMVAEIDLTQPWGSWTMTENQCVRQPELEWEGATRPLESSKKGPANNVRQLRDPFVLVDGSDRWLYYSYAGESGIAVAKLVP